MIAALLVCTAAGCFSDPINRKPTVSLVMPSTTPGRKQMVSYTAQISDPDNDQRPEKTMWARKPAPCTGDTGLPSSWPPSSDWFASMPNATILTFDKTGAMTLDGSFCLWVFVTDSHGAMNADYLEIDPQDAAPAPAITVDAPKPAGPVYPLYSTIELSSGASSDLDDGLLPLKWMWTIVDPKQNQVTPMACDNNPKCSFTATVPGTYDVTLTATDPSNETGTTQHSIIVDQDRPPCIQVQGVSPDFQSPMPVPPPFDDTLSIQTVVDDGNPTPPGPMGRTHFLWSISSRSGSVDLTPLDNDRNQLQLTGYSLGDLVRVRVEAIDGQQDTLDALTACGPTKDICTSQDSGCILRLTWSIQF